jgi:hypothetical protein
MGGSGVAVSSYCTWPLRPEAKSRCRLPALRHAWPGKHHPPRSAGVHGCLWRLLLTWLLSRLAFGHGSLGRIGAHQCCRDSRGRGRHRSGRDRGLPELVNLGPSSRSQYAIWPAAILTPSDLPRTVRGRPPTSGGGCGDCYSVSYSPARGASLAKRTRFWRRCILAVEEWARSWSPVLIAVAR